MASASAQDNMTSLSYFGPYGIEPGAKLAHSTRLGNLSIGSKSFDWMFQPSVGWYAKPKFHQVISGVLETGLSTYQNEKKGFSVFSIGTGYLYRSEVTSLSVNFAGDIIGKEREGRQYLQMLISYSYNRQIANNWFWFVKASGVYLFGMDRANSGIVFLEAGVSVSLKNKEE
jgi:hypothetical protein